MDLASMNEHEAQRIAAAIHELRPDWPASSLMTLMRKNLMEKPRRDVAVAFAWVAAEANTAKPARVLEMGPWWTAAGVEGRTSPRPDTFDRGTICTTCSQSRDRCRAIWGGDHEFVSVHEHAKSVAAAKRDVPRIVGELRGGLEPMGVPRPPLDLKNQGEGRYSEHVAALKAKLASTEEAS